MTERRPGCSWPCGSTPPPSGPSPPSPSEIGRWWRPNGLFQFTDGRTGTLAFEPGPDGPPGGDLRRRQLVRRSARCAPGTRRTTWPSAGATPASPPTRAPSCTCASRPSAPRPGSTVEHLGWDGIPPEPRRPPRLPAGHVPAALRRVVAGAAARTWPRWPPGIRSDAVTGILTWCSSAGRQPLGCGVSSWSTGA